MGDFIEPEVERLPLSRGRWVDVKRRLNAGETRQLFARMVKRMVPGEPAELDPEKVGFTMVQQYLVGWSLVDRGGAPVPPSEAAINNLDPDLYKEIRQAIEDHETRVDAIVAQEKKDLASANTSSPTLPSAAG